MCDRKRDCVLESAISAKDQPCGPAAGYYCHRKSKDCLGMHHRKRARTCTVSPETV